jgi:thiamine-phosphate pyrophosphorylase
MLAIEAGEDARGRLEAALASGPIAAVSFLPRAGQAFDARMLQPLVGIAQKAGAAALIIDDARLARTLKADGVHLWAGEAAANYQEARAILGRGAVVGADAGRSRDAAMHLGEDGADYVAFGVPDFVGDKQAAGERRLALVQWWAEIFEVPCVAFDVDDSEDAAALARAGADFVAMRLPPTLGDADARAATAGMLAALSLHGA